MPTAPQRMRALIGPADVAVASDGRVFVADSYNHCIRVISPNGIVSTFSGSPTRPTQVTGARDVASFLIPTALAVRQSGESFCHRCRRPPRNRRSRHRHGCPASGRFHSISRVRVNAKRRRHNILRSNRLMACSYGAPMVEKNATLPLTTPRNVWERYRLGGGIVAVPRKSSARIATSVCPGAQPP